MVYILDQVRALEEALLRRIKSRGMSLKPQIVVVTRLIPDAHGTKCNQEIEPIINTKHSHILRVPFRTNKGVFQQWVSRFDIYPYLETFAQVYSVLPLLCSNSMDLKLTCYQFVSATRMLKQKSFNIWDANRIS